jgi:SAM-dependent methyltransferase
MPDERRGRGKNPVDLLRRLTWRRSLDLYDTLRFCGCSWFWKVHFRLWREYRHHSLKRPEGSFTYGETPTSSIVEVLKSLSLAPGQRLVDLGSGRGLPCLVAASLGYEAFGLEYFGEHVERSQRVADVLGLAAHFQVGDFLTDPWPVAEAYFTCSTAFDKDVRAALEVRLGQLPDSTWLVTQDWNLAGPFQLVRSQRLPVTWGTANFRYFRKT